MSKLRSLSIAAAIVGSSLFAAARLSMHDRMFAIAAEQGGLAEVQFGQVAASEGINQQVKDFGQKMVDDHTSVDSDLQIVASEQHIAMPTEMTASDQKFLARLHAIAGGRDFDREYIAAMVKDHLADVAAFEKEISSGTDPAVKAFAVRNLPIIKEHLRMANATAIAVGAN